MRRDGDQLVLHPTDLSSFFECEHKTALELMVARRELEKPGQSEVERMMLAKRGHDHEARVLAALRAEGRHVTEVSGAPRDGAQAVEATLAAMVAGADAIYQGRLVTDGWTGRPDFLVRTNDAASAFGPYGYWPLDAKLARQETGRAVLQLCTYAEQLETVQGSRPDFIGLALGADQLAIKKLRTADYFAYFQRARDRLHAFVGGTSTTTYPEPVEHCNVCEWWQGCEKRRRDDDHLSLVANITRRQRSRLVASGVTQLAQLARLAEDHAVAELADDSRAKLQHQAELQLRRREHGTAVYELLANVDSGAGLELLPKPSPGDLFLDLEGDMFVQGGGLEYLFGVVQLGEPEFDGFNFREVPGAPQYQAHWAVTPQQEKRAFEAVVDRIKLGRTELGDMHVYHFGHREKDALVKLSRKHDTRRDDVDNLLREHVLVDLHQVVRQALRASVEAYSLKELEELHGFGRKVSKRDAARAMQWFGWFLATGEADDPAALRQTLERYNEEDCLSTWKLRDFLESLRVEAEGVLGRALRRPEVEVKQPNEDIQRREAELQVLKDRLLQGLPDAEEEGSPEQVATRLLANLLGWHQREMTNDYREYHEARETPPSEWVESRFVMTGLSFAEERAPYKSSRVYRFRFDEQEHAIKPFPSPERADFGDGDVKRKSFNVHEIGPDYIDLRVGKKAPRPELVALRPGYPIFPENQAACLLAVAESIADTGFDNREPHRAAKDLLLRHAPRCGQELGEPLIDDEAGDNVKRIEQLCLALEASTLSIQGPPGSGKSHRAAHAVVALAKAGKRVGVTANSHQVVITLLSKVCRLANGHARVRVGHVAKSEMVGDGLPFELFNDYRKAAAKLEAGTITVLGGTTYAWTNEKLRDLGMDVLVIDEAGQMSLANTLAVSTAARSLVLVGDPAQLEQPQKGAHPGGAEVSALDHVLGGATTMPADLGVFLPETRRLHPRICEFTSQVFYEGRLKPSAGLDLQCINGPEPLNGTGLRFEAVSHEGNTNRSEEELQSVKRIVSQLLDAGATFTSTSGDTRLLRPGDIMVVAPYNAQVSGLRHVLPDGVPVGTVDKFQGGQAPVVVYSMTTSSAEEAPRGMEFLYSLNRLNVATSRAQALVILVASPALLQARCRTPRQMQLVNALCVYLNRSQHDVPASRHAATTVVGPTASRGQS